MVFGFFRRHKSNRCKWLPLGALFVVLAAFGGPARTQAAGATVRVVYPDGLADVMQNDIAPAFEKATGNQFAGDHAPSMKLASEIREGARAVDVLICASPQANLQLMGLSQGDWVDWYVMFMQSPLVVGYDPASKFAAKLKTSPWYQVAAESGFRLGLTDPKKDAKGRLTAKAIQRAVKNYEQDGLDKNMAANSRIVPAQDALRRLRSHELDAAFFYKSEAAAAGIPSVPVNGGNISTTYTITILNRAPNPGPASAFAAFLVGKEGQKILKENASLTLMRTPVAFGNLAAVPSQLKQILDATD